MPIVLFSIPGVVVAPPTVGGPRWDVPGLRWDRTDLFWDLPGDWLLIPYKFGPESLAETPWLDADFDAVVAHSNLYKEASMPVLTVPHVFAAVGLRTPTQRLDANFEAIVDWLNAWPGPSLPAAVPYTFRGASSHTPLHRLDANFQALADWWNPP